MPKQKGHKHKDAESKHAGGAAKKAEVEESPAKRPLSATRQAGMTLEELEVERQRISQNLRSVEEQVFNLETAYFQEANLLGNALIGYGEFLNNPTELKRKRDTPVEKHERIFSASSVTGYIEEAAATET